MSNPANLETLPVVIDELFKLDSPAMNAAERAKVTGFIETTVNGDKIKSHLVTNANLSPDKPGALVYVLTDRRLIKIEVTASNCEVNSSAFPMDTIISVDRSLDASTAGVTVKFQTGFFGLRFPASDGKITKFFQEVEQSRAKA